MFRGAATWLGSVGGLSKSPSTHSLNALDEPHALEQALQAMALLMNDDVQGAEAALEEGNSSFHKLAQGVIAFLKATLGFEAEIMKEASDKLAEASALADRDRKKVQREPHLRSAYPPGTEFALVHAETQLMSAVIGVLSESIVDAMKAFYKLRRAYLTLEAIVSIPAPRAHTITSSKENDRSDTIEGGKGSVTGSVWSTNAPGSTVDNTGSLPKLETYNAAESRRASVVSSLNMDIMDPMDVFIYSGSNMCFGLLLVTLSFIPPSFGRLLSIIGFRGDRAKGLSMLWKASRADNIHGAIATLALLHFYGLSMQFCDILPDDNPQGVDAYSYLKCFDALVTIRKRYPRSALWLLEEARLEALNGRLETAIELLDVPVHPQMRQVEALMVFEKAINSMLLHRHQIVADSFLKLMELNSWSHALYHYFAAISYVEMYRESRDADSKKADEYASKAETLLERTPSFMGKRRFMAQSLPLEAFVERKLKKWQARASEKNIRLVEGVGISPVEEMIYIWNGYKRMDNDGFAKSLMALEWEKDKLRDDAIDERAIHSLLTGVVLRNMGEMGKAKEHLQDVIAIDKQKLKDNFRDNWTVPTAHYEWAVVLWQDHEQRDVVEAREWLQKVAKWEAYELDNRIGMRVTMALDTINKFVDSKEATSQ